jgi:hypothetical protein
MDNSLGLRQSSGVVYLECNSQFVFLYHVSDVSDTCEPTCTWPTGSCGRSSTSPRCPTCLWNAVRMENRWVHVHTYTVVWFMTCQFFLFLISKFSSLKTARDGFYYLWKPDLHKQPKAVPFWPSDRFVLGCSRIEKNRTDFGCSCQRG